MWAGLTTLWTVTAGTEGPTVMANLLMVVGAVFTVYIFTRHRPWNIPATD